MYFANEIVSSFSAFFFNKNDQNTIYKFSIKHKNTFFPVINLSRIIFTNLNNLTNILQTYFLVLKRSFGYFVAINL